LIVFLQTARERDVLCTVLNALINKKKEMKQERKQTKDVIRLEIYPILPGQNDNANLASGTMTTQEKKKLQDKEIKLKLAREQINQLKMESTQMLEEKRVWKNEKEKLQEVGKMKTEQINKLTKEKKDLSEQFQKIVKERDSLKQIGWIDNKKDSLADEKKESARLEKTGEDLQAQVKSLKNEIEDLTKKNKEKDTKISQLQQELMDLTEDKCQMQSYLKTLNEQVGNVTEIRSKMDSDFAKLNEDKIQLKSEVREWQQKYERLERETRESIETEQKKKKEWSDKYNDLSKTHKDMKYEVARRDEEIHRLKAEIEQLQGDLQTELKEKDNKERQLKVAVHKIDKLTTKNAQMQEHSTKLEDQLDGSVTRQEWEALRTEYITLQKALDSVTVERDKVYGEVSTVEREKNKLTDEMEKMKKEMTETKQEISKLEAHQNFWRSRANSIQEELQKVIVQARPSISSGNIINGNHPHVQKQLDAKKELEKEVKKLLEEKQTAENAVSTYRRAFEDEMSKHKNEVFRHSLFRSRITEDIQSLMEKNQQLQILANELADTVADREENIKHLKEVKHLLGMRVKVVEEENNSYRQKLGLSALVPQGSNFLKDANQQSGRCTQSNGSAFSPKDNLSEEAKT
ncbi:viral A-type inclusion protein, partial [Reticulomyxa filosa]